jgi:protein phosphatase PTC7
MFRLLSLTNQFCKPAGQLRYKFEYAFHMSPHPEKAYKGGEDAVFTSNNVLLVADGVGGWADSGVDPALYSKRLAKIVEELV